MLKAMGVDCTLLVTRDGGVGPDVRRRRLQRRPPPEKPPRARRPTAWAAASAPRLWPVQAVPHHQKIAFCRLVVALAHLDTDALVDALRDLGLELPKTIEPFQMLKGMAFAFRDTESDPHKARKRLTSTLRKSRKERNALKEAHKARDAKEASAAAAAAAAAQNDARAPHPPRRPRRRGHSLAARRRRVLHRTLMMLQGLSTTLGVSMAFAAARAVGAADAPRAQPGAAPRRLAHAAAQAAAAAAAATSPRPSVRSSL